MARTKTSSIIKTRLQSRTGTTACTGTKARTTDPVVPAPVAVDTGCTTGTTNPVVTTTDPAPVDLLAGRPTTGTLKDPPPAVPTPRDRALDSDSDNDDANKKPAAKPSPKPKGRPKKVAPKARKPRKPRTDPADDLVDPMSRVHVGDAGGFARAGGYDPVLANPEQDPEQPEDEPQPKKKTRRAVD